jgi:hypothetical protein
VENDLASEAKALADVLDWCWQKHKLISGESRPCDVDISAEALEKLLKDSSWRDTVESHTLLVSARGLPRQK